MVQPGYNPANESVLWWKVAMHLDEAQLALANAMALNVDDPTAVHALQEKIREGQAILLTIFRAKGLLPAAPNGKHAMPEEPPSPAVPVMPEPAVPDQMIEEGDATDESSVAVVEQTSSGNETDAAPSRDAAPPTSVSPTSVSPDPAPSAEPEEGEAVG